MSADTLLALAERLEAAAGPSAYLDAQIFIVIDPDAQHIVGQKPGRFPQEPIYGPRSSFWEWAIDETTVEPPVFANPKFTTSVDAALTLVPEGWRIGFEDNASCDEPNKVYAWVWPFASKYDPDWQMGQEGQQSNPDALKGYAATRALAICAAALRAIAAQESNQ